MSAAAFSFRDVRILRGDYVLPVKDDVVPLAEGAGTVVSTGPGVTDLPAGTRVLASVFPRWLDGPFGLDRADQLGGSLDGMLTEYALLSRDALLEVPEHLTLEEAATLPCSALTAWNALTGARPVLPGETVLTLGAGGVSLFAVQLATLLGARVIATTGDDAKADRLRELGASEVVNYRQRP